MRHQVSGSARQVLQILGQEHHLNERNLQRAFHAYASFRMALTRIRSSRRLCIKWHEKKEIEIHVTSCHDLVNPRPCRDGWVRARVTRR